MPGPASSTRKRTDLAVVLDSEQGGASAIALGVLEQVGEDPLEAAFVNRDAAGWLCQGRTGSARRCRSPRRCARRVRRWSPRRGTGRRLPRSDREISSSSSTRRLKRRTSAPSRSRACRALGVSSSRLASRTESELARVVSGERSSWLTSEAKLASRSIRSWSRSTILLNAAASAARSAKLSLSRRVSRLPPAMARAARVVSCSGRRARAAAHSPSTAPAKVVMSAARVSAARRICSVFVRSARLNISK